MLFRSTKVERRLFKIFVYNLENNDVRDIGRKLLQTFTSPFLWIGTMTDFVHWLGKCSH